MHERIFMGHEEGPPEETSSTPLEQRNKLDNQALRDLIEEEIQLGIYQPFSHHSEFNMKRLNLYMRKYPNIASEGKLRDDKEKLLDELLEAELKRRK